MPSAHRAAGRRGKGAASGAKPRDRAGPAQRPARASPLRRRPACAVAAVARFLWLPCSLSLLRSPMREASPGWARTSLALCGASRSPAGSLALPVPRSHRPVLRSNGSLLADSTFAVPGVCVAIHPMAPEHVAAPRPRHAPRRRIEHAGEKRSEVPCPFPRAVLSASPHGAKNSARYSPRSIRRTRRVRAVSAVIQAAVQYSRGATIPGEQAASRRSGRPGGPGPVKARLTGPTGGCG